MQLELTQQEYQKLRDSGLSQQDIVSRYAKKPESFGQKALNVGSAVSKFVGAGGISEQFGASLARTKLKLQGKPEVASLVENPSLKRVVGSAIQTGANLLPGAGVGAGLARKVATGAATGYAFDVGANLQLQRPTGESFRPGIGTVVGGGLPVLGKILGYAGKDLTGKAARKLEEINLRLTPVEKQNLAKKGKDIQSYLARNKVIGTPEKRLAKVARLYDQMEKKVQSEVNKANVTFPTASLVDDLKKIPDAFIDDPELANESVTTINKLITNLQTRGANIDTTAINNLKRNYMKRAFAKNTTDVLSESRLAIAATLNKQLRLAIPTLEKLNNEYGYIIAARRAMQKAVSRPQIGLTGKLIGITAGTAIGGSLGGGAGAAAGAMVGPTIGKTVAGTLPRSVAGAGFQTLSNFTQALQNLPTDKAGNVSKKALLNLLEGLKQ